MAAVHGRRTIPVRRRRILMLFGMVYIPRSSTEAASAERSLRLFADWRPPVEFKDHWDFVTGGGMGVIESSSSGVLAGAIAPFTPFFDFTLEQVTGREEAESVFVKTNAQPDLVA
jgi:hypothetical protein